MGQRQIFIFKTKTSSKCTDLGLILSHEAIKLCCFPVPWHFPHPLRCHILLKDFLRVNLGCPVAPLPLLSCQPGILLKIPLKVWAQLEGGLSPFPTCYRLHISKQKRGGWFGPCPLPTATASGNHRRCFQLCCLHSSSDKWAGFLPCSQGCLFVQTTTCGPSFCHHLLLALPLWPCVLLKVKWQFPCVSSFATWSPTAGSSAPTDVPKNLAATAWGSQEMEPMSMLWVMRALNNFWGSVCAMDVPCLMKMALILVTKVLQPCTKPANPPNPCLAGSAWGRTCE